MGVVRTYPVDEYFVIRTPRIIFKSSNLSSAKFLSQPINAVEARARHTAPAKKAEIRCNTEFVHLLHAGDVYRAINIICYPFNVLRQDKNDICPPYSVGRKH